MKVGKRRILFLCFFKCFSGLFFKLKLLVSNTRLWGFSKRVRYKSRFAWLIIGRNDVFYPNKDNNVKISTRKNVNKKRKKDEKNILKKTNLNNFQAPLWSYRSVTRGDSFSKRVKPESWVNLFIKRILRFFFNL